VEQRYSRQAEVIGKKAQEKLCKSRIAVVGLGGLGCAVSLYLAAAGANLVLVDCDRVEESNLPRQVLYAEKDVGRKKTDAAESALRERNSLIRIETIDGKVNRNTVGKMSADVIVDCTDDDETRFVVNERARELGVPYVYGACSGWAASVAVLTPEGPSLRSILRGKRTAEKGVLGPVVAVTGAMQALCAVRALVLRPKAEWLHFDAEKLEFSPVKLPKKPLKTF